MRRTGTRPPAMVPVMRTVFISEDARCLSRARELIGTERLARRIEREPDASADEMACVGSSAEVRDQIEVLRERLGMTHFIASRIRLQGMGDAEMRGSIEALSGLIGL